DETTGRVLVQELHVEIPAARRAQVEASAEALRHEVLHAFPWAGGTRPVHTDLVELILGRTWRPGLALTGVEGIPPLASAGNVLRPFTSVKLSMRIPPRVDPAVATRALKEALEKDPPYGARVTFTAEKSAAGWDAPPLAAWLEKASEAASRAFFG